MYGEFGFGDWVSVFETGSLSCKLCTSEAKPLQVASGFRLTFRFQRSVSFDAVAVKLEILLERE